MFYLDNYKYTNIMCKEMINIKLNICRNYGRFRRYAYGGIAEKEKGLFETEN